MRMANDASGSSRLYPSAGEKAWELPPFITVIYQDQSGCYWIGTCGGGINYFDPDTDEVSYYAHDPVNPNGISNDKIWSFIEDHSGLFWLGTLAQGGASQNGPVRIENHKVYLIK